MVESARDRRRGRTTGGGAYERDATPPPEQLGPVGSQAIAALAALEDRRIDILRAFAIELYRRSWLAHAVVWSARVDVIPGKADISFGDKAAPYKFRQEGT